MARSCSYRIVRGGSWGDPPEQIRSAFRSFAPFPPTTKLVDYRSGGVGFRVAAEISRHAAHDARVMRNPGPSCCCPETRFLSRISPGHPLQMIPTQLFVSEYVTHWGRGWDSDHCRSLKAKNLTGFAFLTSRQIRTKAPVETRIEHADLIACSCSNAPAGDARQQPLAPCETQSCTRGGRV